MPAKSPEAIARKNQRRNERRKPSTFVLKKSDLPAHKIARRNMMGKMPEMTKSELRQMLTDAVRNTR